MFQFCDLTLTVLCTMLDKRLALSWMLCQLFQSKHEISSRRHAFDICLLVSALPAFRLRVEEQMHAFKAFKCVRLIVVFPF